MSDSMRERRWTNLEIVAMPKDEFKIFRICLAAKAYRLLGINWNKHVCWFVDPITQDLVVQYE
jgi:hypothetical protein